MNENLFPIPKAGRITVTPTGPDEFEIQCGDLDTVESYRLWSFFTNKLGLCGAFQYAHAGVFYPRCRFNTDAATFAADSVTLPIKILQ
jgi:hypothetical protein